MATMSLVTIALGLMLLFVGLILLSSGRRKEEDRAPAFGWDSSRLPYDG